MKEEEQYYVYILAKGRNSTFYTGFTENLAKRVYEHKNELADGFTKKCDVKMLVYYEVYNDYETALNREKRLKKWNRPWKMRLIEEMNLNWEDLYEKIYQ